MSTDIQKIAMTANWAVAVFTGCIVNRVQFMTEDCDSRRITQNSDVYVVGIEGDRSFDFYGVIEEVIVVMYGGCHRLTLLKCQWFDLRINRPVLLDPHMVSINTGLAWYCDEPFIVVTQAGKVFYLPDTELGPPWKVAVKFKRRGIYDRRMDRSQNERAEDIRDFTEDAFQMKFPISDRVHRIPDDPSALNREDDDYTLIELTQVAWAGPRGFHEDADESIESEVLVSDSGSNDSGPEIGCD